MPANPDKAQNKTSQEWKAVAAQYEQQNEELAKQVAGYDAQLASIKQQQADISNQIKGLRNQGLTNKEFAAREADLTAQRRALTQQNNAIQNDREQTTTQISDNKDAIAKANTRADIAQEGEALADTTTPPASQNPGDGATVPPAAAPTQTINPASNVTPAQDPTQTQPIVATVENAAPVVTQQYANRPDPVADIPPAEPRTALEQDPNEAINRAIANDIPVTQRTVDEDPAATINQAIANDIPVTPRTALEQDPNAAIQAALAREAEQQSATPSLPAATGSSVGLQGAKVNTQAQATSQDATNAAAKGDWRVRLSLAPNANYLYKAKEVSGILAPLAVTNGIIFPYLPTISVSYSAGYSSDSLTHSNYKIQYYQSSSVDSISLGCEFTAQDTYEANYLLAVIHFFRTATKMFYGQDENPKRGTPPPLCFLTGLGAFQFDKHPLVITGFTYTLPTDVDYIMATNTETVPGGNKSGTNARKPSSNASTNRLINIMPGGVAPPAQFTNPKAGTTEPTYVPTKINLSISAVPIVTRNDISNNFSVKKYATGELLRGSKRASGGGIW
jgi:hypothetical protein